MRNANVGLGSAMRSFHDLLRCTSLWGSVVLRRRVTSHSWSTHATSSTARIPGRPLVASQVAYDSQTDIGANRLGRGVLGGAMAAAAAASRRRFRNALS